MATAVLQAIQDEELLALAREAGAEGIKVYGSMCTGQELMQRKGISASNFSGQLGNWISQEHYVATGAVDLVMMDMNCSIPGLKTVADKFHTKLVSVSRILRMDGVTDNVDYEPEKVAEQARELVKMAIAAYKNRDREKIFIPQNKSGAVAGFSVESILGALGGSLTPLLDAVRQGSNKGIVAVVGCTNNRNGHDGQGLTIMRELIKNNVLVIAAGCMSSAAEIESLMLPEAAAEAGDGLKAVCQALGIPPVLNFGSCVDIGRIGVAVTAIADALGVDPAGCRWPLPLGILGAKAVADGIFAVAFGLLTHLGPVPPVTGSPLVTRILTEDMGLLTGGKVLVEESLPSSSQNHCPFGRKASRTGNLISAESLPSSGRRGWKRSLPPKILSQEVCSMKQILWM